MSGVRRDAFVKAVESGALDEIPASADRELLRYAHRLTTTPGEVERRDVERLRAEGFDDRAIHDACAIVAYYAFVNRIADGLGVELEPDRRGPGPDRS